VNDLAFVLRAVDLLRSHGVRTWLCGGWAEELRGQRPPGEHADLDLLYPAPDWARIDELELDWIEAKRAPWKRAFSLEGTSVELLLVERDSRGWFTRRAGQRHDWPPDVFSANGRVGVASAAALSSYRASYRRAA
jgi:Aminoglycoside-2''-adenylyltransferase